MLVYSARQAILNRRSQVVAYELFFRSGPENFFPADVDPHEATSKLIGRTHFNKGIRPITGGKRAFINFSEKSLIDRLPLLLPQEDIIIEILEDVNPTDDVYRACVELHRFGYRFALDDFIYKPEWKRFIRLVNLIKFDIQHTTLDEIEPVVKKLREKNEKKLLAEKVETQEEFDRAVKMGFSFFQGYFFCKPEMHSNHEAEANEHLMFLIYKETIADELNYKKITQLLEQDSNLIYKLLCFLNSGGFPLKSKIKSVKQALTYLGDDQLRRLLSLFVTAILASNKPVELIKMCVIRAKFCESVSRQVAPTLVESAFLMGMFSLMDAILDSTMHDVLQRLAVCDDVAEALLDTTERSQTPLSLSLRAIKYLEQGRWYQAEREAIKLRLDKKQLSKHYQDAVIWAECIQNGSSSFDPNG
ncbi:EAL and HDOD domain-containing protein [Psychrobium sp. 1_MG-2023]|uniref:EAL and HDOD domain-containing protein n=1 Tax=Psychrobium sp. 1_MG-2023 TaxID=3062624 RepID=UPI000C338CA5|nr:EAL domain-containing protein [Psychrobium sp. 1_MG-2023]MDP2562750.1 EAL domain-containing protein [Psychrobium sp. 1_MG-2023]PKF54173.1 histidine kinase [Alteromonadales bacterium alter-6D02]